MAQRPVLTRDEWLHKLRQDRPTLEDIAQMLALRDERVATLDETVRALVPSRTEAAELAELREKAWKYDELCK